MELTRSDWRALARKYATLVELRRTQHESRAGDVRVPLRQLSREFPGSLRELDALPFEEIERRARCFEAAAEGGAPEPWMEWMHHYHATMRVALAVKRRLGGLRTVSESHALLIASEASDPEGARIDASFVLACAQPPSGRLNRVVLERLRVRFRQDEAEIVRVLFGGADDGGEARRPSE